MGKNKNANRRAALNAEPANTARLGTAIRELDEFFNPHSRHWTEPLPVWLGLALMPQMENFAILLGEYRRMRAELLVTRNEKNRLSRELLQAYKDHYELRMSTRVSCRRRLQPIVQLLLK